MSTYIALTPEQFDSIQSGLKKIERLEQIFLNKDANQSSIWVSTKEAMEILGVGETTLWSYRKQGIISASKINKKLYYNRKDLNKVISSNEIKK